MPEEDRRSQLRNRSQAALLRAARTAIERGRATNTPVYILENGQIVNLLATPGDATTPARPETVTRVREELDETE